MALGLGAMTAISAGGSLLGSIFGNRAARKRQEQANTDNIAFWKMQNKYNDPKAQMQRLQSAGLNPNLIYGGSTGQASGMAEKIAPSKASPTRVDNPLSNITQFANIEQSKAQTDNLQRQNDVLIQESALKGAQIADIATKTARTKFDLNLAQDLRKNSLDFSNENIRQMELKTIGSELDNRFKQGALKDRLKSIMYEVQNAKIMLKGNVLNNRLKQYELELNKLGITKGDNLLLRILGFYKDDIIKDGKVFGRIEYFPDITPKN